MNCGKDTKNAKGCKRFDQSIAVHHSYDVTKVVDVNSAKVGKMRRVRSV